MGDQSLPSSIREREKILSSCLRSSLLTIESPYFEQATLLLERHGVESLSGDLYSELEFLSDGGGRVQEEEGQDEEPQRVHPRGDGGSNNTALLSPIGTPNRWTGVQSDGAADATFSVSIRPSLSCLASVFGKSGAGLSSTTAAAPAFLHPSPAGGRRTSCPWRRLARQSLGSRNQSDDGNGQLINDGSRHSLVKETTGEEGVRRRCWTR